LRIHHLERLHATQASRSRSVSLRRPHTRRQLPPPLPRSADEPELVVHGVLAWRVADVPSLQIEITYASVTYTRTTLFRIPQLPRSIRGKSLHEAQRSQRNRVITLQHMTQCGQLYRDGKLYSLFKSAYNAVLNYCFNSQQYGIMNLSCLALFIKLNFS